MDSNKAGQGLLQRIDKMVEELQLLRREVATLLVKQAECEGNAARHTPTPTSHSGGDNRPSISCVSSLEELFALDFETTDRGIEAEAPAMPSVELTEAPIETPGTPSLEELFIETGSEKAMEELFEERKHFDLLSNLSIADRYLFANKLFMGDQAALTDMLSEIEHLSDMAHVRDYLFGVRQFGEEEEEVQFLLSFIEAHSC